MTKKREPKGWNILAEKMSVRFVVLIIERKDLIFGQLHVAVQDRLYKGECFFTQVYWMVNFWNSAFHYYKKF